MIQKAFWPSRARAFFGVTIPVKAVRFEEKNLPQGRRSRRSWRIREEREKTTDLADRTDFFGFKAAWFEERIYREVEEVEEEEKKKKN
ncbi:MAG: hypothetical protein LBL44_05465 [Treponema sp.]|jgi:hypothetical protein|nr:hypothetical protein [Treponema sp.]